MKDYYQLIDEAEKRVEQQVSTCIMIGDIAGSENRAAHYLVDIIIGIKQDFKNILDWSDPKAGKP